MSKFIATILCSLMMLTGFAKKPPLTSLYLSLPDQIIKCQAISEKMEMSFKQPLTYYWYAHNNVFQTQGGADGRILHGAYKAFYLSNQLRESGSFYKGLKHKTWTTWYESGKLHEVYTWRKGVLNGTHKVFNDKGELVLEERLKNGILSGTQNTYENGKLKSSKKFSNGVEKVKAEKKKKAPKDSTKQGDVKKQDKTATPVVGEHTANDTNGPGTEAPKKKKFRLFGSKKNDKAGTAQPAETTRPAKAKKEKQATESNGPKAEKKPFFQRVKGWFKRDKKKQDTAPANGNQPESNR